MVIKKTVKRAAPARKKISPVIVETKKHQDDCCTSSQSHKKCFGILLIVLLLLNLIVSALTYFRSNSAWDVEIMKVGGVENLELVKQLYEMDSYKAQQKGAIMQVLGSFDNVGSPEEAMMPQQLPVEEMPIE